MNFRLGINYWPISSAMHWWERFDGEEVARDFEQIAQAGFDSVRIFLLWETFQPSPNAVSDQSLARLVDVADVAKRSRLSLVPTLFTGHMSGVNWIPEWALEEGDGCSRFRIVSNGKVVRERPRNWYTDPGVLSAQRLLAREVASALSNHPAVWAYDLGNENSNCVVPPSRESAVAWLEQIAGEIRYVDPSRPITMGLHMEDLEEDRKLGPQEAGRVCEFLSMHGYPIYADWAESKTDAMVLPFLAAITRWLGGREVLFEEFGAPATDDSLPGPVTLLGENEAARFTHDALEGLLRSGCLGAMVWCYGDYAEWLWRWPPLDDAIHERYFGLWRSDHSPKPAAGEIGRLVNVEVCEPPEDLGWVDIDPSAYYADPRENLRRLYREYRERV
ncbi:MAG TPA: cellulase family glycosylhydrolase [Blastocatellia bacterium]|nr:cellulase family glycosylhydrolase [Blastocatellia bacterium]